VTKTTQRLERAPLLQKGVLRSGKELKSLRYKLDLANSAVTQLHVSLQAVGAENPRSMRPLIADTSSSISGETERG
jgi:hypothetical protein